jgi:hypothetical protein
MLGLMISVANGAYAEAENVYEEISSNLPAATDDYCLDSRGGITGAAVDYVVLLSVVGSVASVASLLWQAYEKWIAPRHDRGSLYICIDPKKDLQWMLGEAFKDKDSFVADFTHKVEAYIETDEGKHRFIETARMVKRHPWTPRKRKRK